MRLNELLCWIQALLHWRFMPFSANNPIGRCHIDCNVGCLARTFRLVDINVFVEKEYADTDFE